MKLIEGLKAGFSRKGIAVTIFSTVFLTILMVFASFPTYSIQMVGRGSSYPLIAFQTLLDGIILDSGYIGALLILIYGLTSGVLVSNILRVIRSSGIKKSGYLTTLTPTAVVGACGACGAGLVALFGTSTALALTPFGGNLWRLAGIAITLAVIHRIGDPDSCKL